MQKKKETGKIKKCKEKNERIILLLKSEVCHSKKSKFIKEQKTSGLLSS